MRRQKFRVSKVRSTLLVIFAGMVLNTSFAADGQLPADVHRTDSMSTQLTQEADRVLMDMSIPKWTKEEMLLQMVHRAGLSPFERGYAADALEALGSVADLSRLVDELQQPEVQKDVRVTLLRLLGKSLISMKASAIVASGETRDRAISTLRIASESPIPAVAVTATRALYGVVSPRETYEQLRRLHSRGQLSNFDYAREILAVASSSSGTEKQDDAISDALATTRSSGDPILVSEVTGLLATRYESTLEVGLLNSNSRALVAQFLEQNTSIPTMRDSNFDFGNAVMTVSSIVARNKLRGVSDADIPAALLNSALNGGGGDVYLASILMSEYAQPVVVRASELGISDAIVSRLKSAQSRSLRGSTGEDVYSRSLDVVLRFR